MKKFKYLNNKVVIVTGASTGIGRATAVLAARNGARVLMAARSEEKLQELSTSLKEEGLHVMYVVTDVSREEDCRKMVEACVERFGTIDILINNAGISMRALFLKTEKEVLERLMQVNFWGTVYCTRYALPYILQNKGSVVGVSSVAGFHGLPGRTGYSASKFAMHGFLETIRIEHLKEKLHVMVIAPGFTASDIRKHALTCDGSEQGDSPRKEEKLMSPEYVAFWIFKGIRKRKRNKIMTWDGRLTALLQRIVPDMVDRAYYNHMAREPNSPFSES